jgi:hypothetical protein
MRARVSNHAAHIEFRNRSDPDGPTPRQQPRLLAAQSENLDLWRLRIDASLSAAALTGAAFSANTTGTGTDHLVAAAY